MRNLDQHIARQPPDHQAYWAKIKEGLHSSPIVCHIVATWANYVIGDTELLLALAAELAQQNAALMQQILKRAEMDAHPGIVLQVTPAQVKEVEELVRTHKPRFIPSMPPLKFNYTQVAEATNGQQSPEPPADVHRATQDNMENQWINDAFHKGDTNEP